MSGPSARPAGTERAAAEDLAETLVTARSFAPDVPRREEDDLCTRVPGVPSHEARKTRNMSVLLRTPAAVPAQFPADTGQGPEFFMCAHGLMPAKRHG